MHSSIYCRDLKKFLDFYVQKILLKIVKNSKQYPFTDSVKFIFKNIVENVMWYCAKCAPVNKLAIEPINENF